MHKSVSLLILVAITRVSITPLLAAEDEEFLPIGLTDEEKTRLHEIGINHQRSAPPSGVMRASAEWEHCEKVLIRWPLGIPLSLVAEMSEDVIVATIVSGAAQQSSATSSYNSAGVNMANVEFITAPTNSIWTRDYGPWTIFDGNGDIGFVDHIYNRPRPQDDVIPQAVGTAWGIPVYGMSLITAGGNHMCDGEEMSMSTRLVYDENPSLSQLQVHDYISQYLGNNYTVLEYVESGGIHHIDCWAKFLSPTTILVERVAPGAYNYQWLEDRADLLSQMISPWGEPYTIVRVDCPNGQAYTNSLILNRKVFVPTFSSSLDDDALQVYEDAMPGYEIIGFNGSWLSDDAIHCRAMGIPDGDVLFVDHKPLHTTGDTVNDYEVKAFVYPHSGANLIIDSLRVYYSVDGAPSQHVQLLVTADPDSFAGYIPAQPAGSEIRYFIKAADEAIHVATHPYIGEPSAHSFNVNMAPQITSDSSCLVMTGSAFQFTPEFIDIDDATHTVSFANLPAWLTETSGTLSGTLPGAPVEDQFLVMVADDFSTDSLIVTVKSFVCGDSDGSGQVSIGDAVFIINYIFGGGPSPVLPEAADPDCSGGVSIGDAVYIINFIFGGGPVPCENCP
jgi:agmatine/peptidylarginine deiminase